MQLSSRSGKSCAANAKGGDSLKDEIAKIDLPETFQAPFDPRITLGKLIVDKSKIMDSKKRPLWLEFVNADSFVVSESNNIERLAIVMVTL